jgi:nitrogen regulatory protein PII
MKKIEALIKPFALNTVISALNDKGINSITISEVKGYGWQKGHIEVYRGAEYVMEFIPKVKIEMVVVSEDAESIGDCIRQAANNDKIGDGKIFILPIEDIIRIRSGERGKSAILKNCQSL